MTTTKCQETGNPNLSCWNRGLSGSSVDTTPCLSALSSSQIHSGNEKIVLEKLELRVRQMDDPQNSALNMDSNDHEIFEMIAPTFIPC